MVLYRRELRDVASLALRLSVGIRYQQNLAVCLVLKQLCDLVQRIYSLFSSTCFVISILIRDCLSYRGNIRIRLYMRLSGGLHALPGAQNLAFCTIFILRSEKYIASLLGRFSAGLRIYGHIGQVFALLLSPLALSLFNSSRDRCRFAG